MSKGSTSVFPFFDYQSTNAPSNPLKAFFRAEWLCKTAFFAFSLGPNELLTVALLQCRLGLVRKSMGLIGLTRRI